MKLYYYIENKEAKRKIEEAVEAIQMHIPQQLWDEVLLDITIDLSDRMDSNQAYPTSQYMRAEAMDKFKEFDKTRDTRWKVKMNKQKVLQ